MRTSTKFMIRRMIVGLGIIGLFGWGISAANDSDVCHAATGLSDYSQVSDPCLDSDDE